LYMIFVDHIIGDPLAKFTYQHVVFSDSAEIFVYLSGLSCGISYSRTLARRGWVVMALAILRRAAKIYVYYVVSCSVVITLAAVAAVIWNINAYGELLSTSAGDPFTAMRLAMYMLSPPGTAGILVLYIILTSVVVPVFLIGTGRCGPLVASGLLWVFSQNLPDFVIPHDWFFNPFAWQFLFVIGMFVGAKWDSTEPAMQILGRLNWLVFAAWTIVVSAFLYKLFLLSSSHFGAEVTTLQIAPDAYTSMRRNLSSIRLLHFLSVALLVATYFRSTSTLLRLSISFPLICSGKRSLELYSLSMVLNTLANIAVLAYHPPYLVQLAIDVFGISVITMTAIALV